MTTWPNHAAPGKAGITRLLTIEHHCPGLPEPGRSATLHKIMKAISLLLSVIATAFLFGCGSTPTPTPRQRDFSGMPATEIVVSVSCSDPGMHFAGTIVSDGQTEQFSGAGSGTFHASGHEFVCSFQKTGVAGRISLSVSEGGERVGRTSTAERLGGVRAELLRTPLAQHTSFTTF